MSPSSTRSSDQKQESRRPAGPAAEAEAAAPEAAPLTTARAILRLQGTVGNRAVQRHLATHGTALLGGPGRVIQRNPDPPQWAIDLQAEMRRSRGDGGLGVTFWRDEPFGSLSEDEARRGLALFRAMPSAAQVRMARAWNRNLDHLQSDFHSVLDFVLFMDRFLRQPETGGQGVVAIYRAPGTHMATTTLAGATGLRVHPWALYFAAAAQVGMDVAARIGEGEGHYIAPAAMFVELRSIHSDINLYLRQAQSGTARGAQAFHGSISSRLSRIMDVVQAQRGRQRTGPGYHPSEAHREPRLVEWISEPARHASLQANRRPAGSNAEAMTRLVAIRDALSSGMGELPQRVAEHGWGAMDPHGALHGVGLALDMFNSTDPQTGSYGTNFGMRREAWPFIEYLIQEHGAAYGFRGGEGRADVETNTREGARRRFNLAGLVQAHWPALRRTLEGPGTHITSAIEIDLMRAYDQGLGALRQMLQRRINALHQGSVRNFGRHPAVRRAAANAVEAMRQLRERCDRLRPERLLEELDRVIGLLHEVLVAAESPPALSERAQAAVSRADPIQEDRSQDLTVLWTQIQTDLPALRRGYSGREMDRLREAYRRNQRVISTWFDLVSRREERIFDQPAEFVEGLLSVGGTSFYGGHHWQIDVEERPAGGEGPSLPTRGGYAAALRQDLGQRDAASLRRVLTTMAENPSGYNALFGDAQGAGRDTTLEAALRQWAEGEGRPSYDSLMGEVEGQVARPESLGSPLLQSLQRQGYRELATELAGGGGGSAGD
jgi:hypothetical protein